MKSLLPLCLVVILATVGVRPEVCNGLEGLCKLRFDQVTFPGSHNSDANTNMHYRTFIHTWVIAIPCFYKNQDLSITGQLDFGLRMLDLDSCELEGDVWGCHNTAYGHRMSSILQEIDNWLNRPENRNEVIALRFHDTNVKGFKRFEQLFQQYLTGKNGKVGINAEKGWPTLGEAVRSNKRVFVFTNDAICDPGCRASRPHIRWLAILDTWKTRGATNSCWGIIPDTKKKCSEQLWRPLTMVSVIASYGLCTWDLQHLCNKHMAQSVYACYNERNLKAGKTVNFITADFVQNAPSNQNVVTIARELNLINIRKYSR